MVRSVAKRRVSNPRGVAAPAQQHLEPAMAAYGLYTHIQSNKRRSVALLIGLFFLVYLLVFAGALAGEALTSDARHGAVDLHRLQIPSKHDRRGDRRARGDAAGGAAAL